MKPSSTDNLLRLGSDGYHDGRFGEEVQVTPLTTWLVLLVGLISETCRLILQMQLLNLSLALRPRGAQFYWENTLRWTKFSKLSSAGASRTTPRIGWMVWDNHFSEFAWAFA